MPSDGEPLWFGRGQDANGAKRTTWLSHRNIVGYADHYVQSTERHPMDRLAEVLKACCLDKGVIGVELDNYWFTAAYLALQSQLPNARLADGTALVNWLRAVKSETEIEYMRRADR